MSWSGHAWPRTASAGERVDKLYALHLELEKLTRNQRHEDRARVDQLVQEERDARINQDQQLDDQLKAIDQTLEAALETVVEVNVRGLPLVLVGLWYTALPGFLASGNWWRAGMIAGVAFGWASWVAVSAIQEERGAAAEEADGVPEGG